MRCWSVFGSTAEFSPPTDTTCITTRGGVYNASASVKRQPLGAWKLGLEYLGFTGNGDYAIDDVVAFDNTKDQDTPLTRQLVAGINDTDYYTGVFGLGLDDFRFNDVVAEGPIAVLASNGIVGSRSYGYTAGAYYGKFRMPIQVSGLD